LEEKRGTEFAKYPEEILGTEEATKNRILKV
jgi:hypothetical protein